jgi:Putative transposase
MAQVQTDLRRRILRAFVGRGLIEKADTKEMLGHQHSGFSVDAGVLIQVHHESTSDKRGAKVDELHLTLLELIDRIAALVLPPRTHRHRYFGVLAPNAPRRAAVTALAAPPKRSPAYYLWAVLIAKIYKAFPLVCPIWGGQMRLIAFITKGAHTRRILDHIGVDSEPPHISPARGPALWDDGGDAQVGKTARSTANDPVVRQFWWRLAQELRWKAYP